MFTDRMAAYWDFAEATGTRYDGVGSSPLFESGAVPLITGKLAPHAAAFDGNAANYLEGAATPALNLNGVSNDGFTIAGWFYLNSQSGTQHLLAKATGSSAAQIDYGVFWQGTGSAFKFVVSDGLATTTALVNGLTAATPGVWHFFACWQDRAAGQIGVRLDDVLGTPASFTSNVQDSGAPLRLGNRAGVGPFNGRLDALGVWKRVLSAAELDALRDGVAGLDRPLSGV